MHRREERVKVQCPVKLNGATGRTRDLSPSGVYFEINSFYEVGSAIEFLIQLERDADRVVMKCLGTIVRTEKKNCHLGVAVSISDSSMGIMQMENKIRA